MQRRSRPQTERTFQPPLTPRTELLSSASPFSGPILCRDTVAPKSLCRVIPRAFISSTILLHIRCAVTNHHIMRFPTNISSPLSRSLRVFQIYGANTDVGKTIVSTLLCKALRKRSESEGVWYLKPVSTGALLDADDLWVFKKNWVRFCG
jgi:hypothetical protein